LDVIGGKVGSKALKRPKAPTIQSITFDGSDDMHVECSASDEITATMRLGWSYVSQAAANTMAETAGEVPSVEADGQATFEVDGPFDPDVPIYVSIMPFALSDATAPGTPAEAVTGFASGGGGGGDPIEIIVRATSMAGDPSFAEPFEIVNPGLGDGTWIFDPVGDATKAVAFFSLSSIPVGSTIQEIHAYREYANSDPGVEFPYIAVKLYDGATLIEQLDDSAGLGALGYNGNPALNYVTTGAMHLVSELFSDLNGIAGLRDVKIKFTMP
jgi:hypothetical protein